MLTAILVSLSLALAPCPEGFACPAPPVRHETATAPTDFTPAWDDEQAPRARQEGPEPLPGCESDQDLRGHRVTASLALGLSGAVAAALGGFALVLDREAVDDGGFRKVCTKGKPCGNSCISWSKECHVGDGDAGYGSAATETRATRSARIAAGALFGVSALLVLLAVVVPRKMRRRGGARCEVARGCGLTWSF